MRRKRNYKRKINPDIKYGSIMVAKFINNIMHSGKKDVARNVVYKSFDIIEKKSKKQAIEVFDEAIKNTSPYVEVKSRRVGGANYQVPREVRGDRRVTLAMRWIIKAARDKKGKPMHEKLAAELIDASKNEGVAIKKKNDTHRMAEANKAFAHFAW